MRSTEGDVCAAPLLLPAAAPQLLLAAALLLLATRPRPSGCVLRPRLMRRSTAATLLL